jgi:prefoldin subunit 5
MVLAYFMRKTYEDDLEYSMESLRQQLESMRQQQETVEALLEHNRQLIERLDRGNNGGSPDRTN